MHVGPTPALAVLASVLISALACTPREPGASKLEAAPEADAPPGTSRPDLVEVELGLVDDEARRALAAGLGNQLLANEDAALLAVRHRIAEGWHIYWLNPGQSGLRTELVIDSEGLTPGATLYPGPERFTAAGGQVTYGWGHEAVLFIPLADVEPGATLSLTSRYLACRESCIPGEATLAARLDALPTARDAGTAAMLARVPTPLNNQLGAAWIDGALHLRVRGELAPADFFPYPHDTEPVGVDAEDSGALTVHYRFTGAPPTGPQGVVSVGRGERARFFEVALPWPTLN